MSKLKNNATKIMVRYLNNKIRTIPPPNQNIKTFWQSFKDQLTITKKTNEVSNIK